MKTGEAIGITAVLVIGILVGAWLYQNHQTDQKRAAQLEACKAPYQKEYEQAQVAFANPLYVQEGSEAMQHATEGLRKCQEQFGSR